MTAQKWKNTPETKELKRRIKEREESYYENKRYTKYSEMLEVLKDIEQLEGK